MIGIKMSVIVAVYNPGKYLPRCVESLLRQSLNSDSYEIILVDDGSTDGSSAILDDYAAAHANVRVHHQENSGWPGKPRNVGIDLARGRYVQFVDQDDVLGPEALERQFDFAVRNDCDVLVGKIVNTVGAVAHNLFSRNHGNCTLDEVPLIRSLSPHKVFKLDFLREHGIRFPEGKCRLEDQLFMVKAYLDARTISVLADYPCYYWLLRDDGKHASRSWSAPEGYFVNLRGVLDAVMARTEPGPFRDRILSRFLEQEMLHRLGMPLHRFGPKRRAELYGEIRKLYLERFHGQSVLDVISPIMRVRAALLAEDRMDTLMEFALRVDGIRGDVRLHNVGWQQGRLSGRLTLTLRHPDGQPVTVRRQGSGYTLDDRLTEGLVPSDLAHLTDELDAFTADVSIKHRQSSVIWFARSWFGHPRTSESADRTSLSWQGGFELDPGTAAGGEPLNPGVWDLRAGVRAFGLSGSANVGACRDRGVGQAPELALTGDPGRYFEPYWTVRSNLAIKATDDDAVLLNVLRRQAGFAPRVDGRTVAVPVPVKISPGAKPRGLPIAVRSERLLHRESALLMTDDAGGAVLSADLSGTHLRPGERAALVVQPAGAPNPHPIAHLRSTRSGHLHARPAVGAVRRTALSVLSRPRVRRIGTQLLRRAPARPERLIRRTVQWILTGTR
ncbi:glycosyltransferase family 2 protein [Flindersiella endophytica]